jgi:C4-dicarboxylate transporter DctM subunit
MKTTGAILLIVAGAKVFGKAITLYRIPQDVSPSSANHRQPRCSSSCQRWCCC